MHSAELLATRPPRTAAGTPYHPEHQWRSRKASELQFIDHLTSTIFGWFSPAPSIHKDCAASFWILDPLARWRPLPVVRQHCQPDLVVLHRKASQTLPQCLSWRRKKRRGSPRSSNARTSGRKMRGLCWAVCIDLYHRRYARQLYHLHCYLRVEATGGTSEGNDTGHQLDLCPQAVRPHPNSNCTPLMRLHQVVLDPRSSL